MDDQFMQRPRHIFATQCGKQTDTVFRGARWQFASDDVCASRHDIGQRDGLFAAGPWFNVAGPADDKRHAMPAFIGVRLPSSPILVQMNARNIKLCKVCLW